MFTTTPSLLERLQQGPNQEAWSYFVDLYTPLLFGWARRLDPSDHDAADLVQDLFAVLVEKLPAFRYDPTLSFRAWLKTILLNRWRNRNRQQTQATVGVGDLQGVAGREDLPAFEEEEYRQALVRRALALMEAEFHPTTCRACWEFVVCDRPAEEVAAELGITVNAVYLAKSRVLRRLRERLMHLLD